MTRTRQRVAKVAVAMMLAGSIAAAVPGVADAATGAPVVQHTSGAEQHRACARDQGRLALSLRRQTHFAARTAVFVRLEADAAKAHHTGLASYWAKVVQRRETYSARHSARYQARVARAHALVNGTCR